MPAISPVIVRKKQAWRIPAASAERIVVPVSPSRAAGVR